MVKIMENPTKMDDLGGNPTIFGNIHIGGLWFWDSMGIPEWGLTCPTSWKGLLLVPN